ncbi:Haloacid dehalogenase-like hydrolase domain-containing protein 3 [Phytophthora boehmeriae]|uniref:Haloacid dehalogenase-like hydrolase domain-containing protein 3 n=1 Tax=Phytophthora boehmeriae TaxID=109152 RepID=A0A8T1WPH4_9STRA|nr:Haloacid dehalogenase-like hydrolase domain-containing protein 3 [Phytophthora boehmeriae]
MAARRTWRYVTLDATGTLLRPAEPTGETYLRYWEQASGQRLSSARRSAAVAALTTRFLVEFRKLSTKKPNFGADGVATSAYPWWHELVLNVMTHAGVAANVPEQIAERYTWELYTHFAQPEAWTVFPDVLPALEILATRGVAMGVISNFDERLGSLLVGLGLSDFFQVATISFREEQMKPDASIFLKTFDKLRGESGKVATHEFLHVGDHVTRDYKAAIAVGAQGKLVWRSKSGTLNSGICQRDVVRSLREIALEAETPFLAKSS